MILSSLHFTGWPSTCPVLPGPDRERYIHEAHELLFSNDAFYLCHHGELHRNPLFAWCGASKWAGQRLWRKQNTSLQNDSHSCCFQDDDLCVLIVGCMLLASPFPSHTRGKESMPHISVYLLKCRYKLPCIIHSIGAHSGNVQFLLLLVVCNCNW